MPSRLKDVAWSVWSWWPYATVAAALALTWFLAGPLALAIASVAVVFLLVGFFVGALSESRGRGILSGLAAAVPAALFFMWLLK
ncbi:MAG TPA: hypothetical protein VF885_05030 [Arthrobacter sp.]